MLAPLPSIRADRSEQHHHLESLTSLPALLLLVRAVLAVNARAAANEADQQKAAEGADIMHDLAKTVGTFTAAASWPWHEASHRQEAEY